MQVNEFRILQDYINSFTNRYEGIVTLDNGFHVNHALIQPSGCDLEDEMYQDYIFGNQFESVFSSFLHPIDEHYLAPSHIRLVQNTYGAKTYDNYSISQYVNHQVKSSYSSLYWLFMNISDKERSLIYSTYESVRKEVLEYGKCSDIGKVTNLLILNLERFGNEVKLDSQIQFLKNKVKARQLRHALM